MKHVLVYGMTDNPGGIETYVLNFFERVQGKGVQLDFISDFPTIAHSERLTAKGAKLFFFPAKSKDLWGHLKGMWKLLRGHKEYKTVYFNILDAGAAITMVPAFLLGRRIVVHSHNGSTDKVKLHKLCKPFLNLMASARVACSRVAAEHMFCGKGKQCLVIPNAIDGAAHRFDPQLREEKRAQLQLGQRPAICHVGRLSLQKNPLGLLDIFEALLEECPQAVLLSVGDGEMAEQFHGRIAEKGLGESVKCLGVRNDVSQILQAADVFLLPSLYEGLPISLLEAQASGLPCVVSDAVSAESAITDRVSFVSLEAEPRIWAQKLVAALQLPRQDCYHQILEAGFDLSCCDTFDQLLLEKF